MLVDVYGKDIPTFYVSRTDRIQKNSSSAGNQIKWYKDGLWFKTNLLGYEGTAEVIVSYFLQFTDLDKSQYVDYKSCIVVEDNRVFRGCCYSEDYISMKGYTEVTVASILEDNLEPFSIDYEDLRMLLYDYLNVDPKDWLDRMLCVDAIIRNCDRHFNNIALLYKNGIYIPSPLYDHGDSCLSDLFTYPMDMPIQSAFNSTNNTAKPFKSNYISNLHDNKKLRVDVDKFISSINVTNMYSKRAVNTILLGLKETEGIAWERN